MFPNKLILRGQVQIELLNVVGRAYSDHPLTLMWQTLLSTYQNERMLHTGIGHYEFIRKPLAFNLCLEDCLRVLPHDDRV